MGDYIRIKDRDYLILNNGRKVNIENASSGQQESLPLLMALYSMKSNSTLIIEEPEAHLYPSAQADMIKLLGLSFNKAQKKSRIIITTHSPYILMSINNLIQASNVNEAEKLTTSAYEWYKGAISPFSIHAYLLKDSKIKNLIDNETGLINAEEIDEISSCLSNDFMELI